MSQASLLRSLSSELFAVRWDASACEGRLALRRACAISDPLHSHHLACAVEALAGAKAALARAERIAARLRKGGAA